MKRRLLAMALLATVAACMSLSSPPSEPPDSESASTAQPPTASGDQQTAAATSPPPGTPRVAPSPLPATAVPTGTEPTPGEPRPPDALLTLPDGAEYLGTVGSWFYGGAAADSPWLPADSLPIFEVDAGTSLLLSAPPLEFVRWGARYADAADGEATVITPLAAGGDGSKALPSATLPAPPSGTWVVAVQLYFAEEQGDATYYWHISVP